MLVIIYLNEKKYFWMDNVAAIEMNIRETIVFVLNKQKD